MEGGTQSAFVGLTLTIRGQQVPVPALDVWHTADGQPVVRSARLRQIGARFGEVPPPPELVFVQPFAGSVWVAMRCAGPDSTGTFRWAIGEAHPGSCDSEIARRFIATMAAKRAADRWLIEALGLGGQVYSDVEMPSQDASGGTGAAASASANGGSSAAAGKGTDGPAADPSDPGSVAVVLSQHRGKTIAQLAATQPKLLLWIRDRYTPRDEQGQRMKDAAAAYLAAHPEVVEAAQAKGGTSRAAG